MQIPGKVTLLMMIASTAIGCVKIDDAAGLEALREPLVDVAESAVRIQDDKLTTDVRVLLGTYSAALGE